MTGPKERDSEARAALGESIELLVSAWASCSMLSCAVSWPHAQPRCRSGATGQGLTLAECTKGQALQAVNVTLVFFFTPAAQAQRP